MNSFIVKSGEQGSCQDFDSCADPAIQLCENGKWDFDSCTCKDKNECEEGTAICRSNSYCEDKVGGYNCPCSPGYIEGEIKKFPHLF